MKQGNGEDMKKKKLVTFLGFIFVLAAVSVGCGNKTDSLQNNINQIEEKKESTEANTDSKTEQNTAMDGYKKTKIVNIYYINEVTGALERKETQISNEKDIWTQLQNTGSITQDCKLLQFKINESEKKIDLDFNKATGDRIRSMGTTGETEILACIINTYLDAYDCEGIKLTEEGDTLETGSGANFDSYSSKIEL